MPLCAATHREGVWGKQLFDPPSPVFILSHQALPLVLTYVCVVAHAYLLFLFSPGAHRFVMTGSDDTNLRIWKANASEKLGKVVPREARKQEYRDSLKKR